jgi:hypothetical protein
MNLAAAILAVEFLTPATAAAEWEQISDRDGIVVYRRNLEGVATISLRGETVIDATVANVFETMKDNATAHEWMPLVAEKRDLEQLSENSRLEYTHIKMPWPLNDRYFVNSGTVEHLANGAMRLFIQSVDHPTFKDDTKVLGELKYSEFLLTPEAGGAKTRIALEVNTDPKGLIPKWMANLAQRNWPRNFLVGLKKQLAKQGKLSLSSP